MSANMNQPPESQRAAASAVEPMIATTAEALRHRTKVSRSSYTLARAAAAAGTQMNIPINKVATVSSLAWRNATRSRGGGTELAAPRLNSSSSTHEIAYSGR